MKRKATNLNPNESISISLKRNQPIEIQMGSKNNRVVIADLSPWYNFKDKDSHLTHRYYVYDPKYYDPKKPDSGARKLIGFGEELILGKARNQIYFGNKGKWDDKLAMEHVRIFLTRMMLLRINTLSNNSINILVYE